MIRSAFTFIPAFVLLLSPVVMAQDESGKKTTDEEKPKITAGPEDPKEKVKPGPIDKDAPEEFTKTDSGLKYRILRKSKKNKPKAHQGVEVHYKGWLDNKEIFDSSYRRGERIKFLLNQVIPGWTEGMQLVGAGGMIELEIPAKLGYGPGGIPGTIPPDATLHFIVELHDIL